MSNSKILSLFRTCSPTNLCFLCSGTYSSFLPVPPLAELHPPKSLRVTGLRKESLSLGLDCYTGKQGRASQWNSPH